MTVCQRVPDAISHTFSYQSLSKGELTCDKNTRQCLLVHFCYTHVLLVSFPDPIPKKGGRGLGTSKHILGFAPSAILFSDKPIRSQLQHSHVIPDHRNAYVALYHIIIQLASSTSLNCPCTALTNHIRGLGLLECRSRAGQTKNTLASHQTLFLFEGGVWQRD